MTNTLIEIERAMDAERADVLADFDAIQMSRPPYVLQKFVVGAEHDTPQQWAQCVLEMSIKYTNIRRGVLNRQQLVLDLEHFEACAVDTTLDVRRQQKSAIKADMKRLDIEEHDRMMIGQEREFWALYQIYKSFEKRYTRDELNAAQPAYWRKRLAAQAGHDIASTGKVGIGNLEALRMMGDDAPMLRAPGLPSATAPVDPMQILGVEKRFLAEGKLRVLIVVVTEKEPPAKSLTHLPVGAALDAMIIPTQVEARVHVIYGMPIDRAYLEAATIALNEGCTHILTIEDDMVPPPDAFVRLLEWVERGTPDGSEMGAVGAWYPKRQEIRQGTSIILRNGVRAFMRDDDPAQPVQTLPMGCTLIATEVFRRTPYPWFQTTAQLTQDSYFSQQAREAGFTLWCDPSLRAKHVDRDTKRVYE